jgi:hypothetical protein
LGIAAKARFDREAKAVAYYKASECHNGLGPFRKFVSDPKNITSKVEKKCAPLQAADAGVFEVRRALNLALKKWDGQLRSGLTHSML